MTSSRERMSAESRGLPHREVTDGLRRPPLAIYQCPRADYWLLRGGFITGPRRVSSSFTGSLYLGNRVAACAWCVAHWCNSTLPAPNLVSSCDGAAPPAAVVLPPHVLQGNVSTHVKKSALNHASSSFNTLSLGPVVGGVRTGAQRGMSGRLPGRTCSEAILRCMPQLPVVLMCIV